MELTLLRAKEAIFKLIGQFHSPTRFEDGELYIYDYCESALESAFNALGIEEDYIKLADFCQMWEDNTRAIWNITLPNESFSGITADIHYDVFKKDFDRRESWLNEDYD
jgi:hypothetical protein